ncbi:aspartate/glutamate racemase family protein [Bradyrhizobium sp. NP1]|uniref:aspartate/glutamate racemase family protein n=1 Tax=Bradyrhizobium sp. NP1 TaxID=3049772 RepID=UPI0025A67AE2|nr:aspartate/glutamate racemase family protein [Bradyrhizobium sp. NP1]WJR80941.1 aspartate/glutamate racemase family protein [Bradyrhizobium sp. NP1]
MKDFISATQALCDRAAAPGTKVEVRGTTEGALGDQFRLFWHYDVREIIANALNVRKSGGYDAFVLANSLDPALVELREMLDIPVVSFMEVCCFISCTMGERFGLVVPNRKMTARYREIPIGYGLRDRLASVEAIEFDNIRGFNDVFVDEKLGDRCVDQILAASRRAIDNGAEVVIPAGPPATLLAQRGIFKLGGVPLLDSYSLLVKAAEMMVSMHKLTGVHVSRHLLYEAPSSEYIQRVANVRNIDALRAG